MDNDYSDPYNPYLFRPKPKKDYADSKPSKRQAAARKARRQIEDLLEARRIEREHSL
ncbi:hypothetical protein [Vibrio vulnificus YJ016]|uniref:Uncharacterized protein n=1 Tax=Vibrio vulnificus (strain YJ016) TaxID=196600 RepID=Q7ME10_VIBVY|nr:hypothetical protein [Vibrio vulnificus]BAC96900.1 hypothetical protein [Vibrio vulnificus YJ016]NHE84316.1 hypothetical protein [Vibrio vulnificus]HDY7440438.1 hypothetical protein [Vibrio vulnificus]HDY7898758.1 hypothetical protein [Vibrio vulnificus]HDY7939028.1 hypothetical protein [Vibrio vulnificus]